MSNYVVNALAFFPTHFQQHCQESEGVKEGRPPMRGERKMTFSFKLKLERKANELNLYSMHQTPRNKILVKKLLRLSVKG